MSTAQLHLISPQQVAEFVAKGRLRQALTDLAELSGAGLTFADPAENGWASAANLAQLAELPIQYRGRSWGKMLCQSDGDASPVARTAGAMRHLLEHMLDREMAVGDLVGAMMTCYDELNLLYCLLPRITSEVYPSEIAEVLVDETARTLGCSRVSLLVLDGSRSNLTLLASRGLPPEARRISIPVSASVAGRALTEDDLLVVDDIAHRPELAALSQGQYESASFAVVRVPLRARGEAVGVLTVTDRSPGPEFTARDRKLLDGLSAIGASALLNCRLHAVVANQMMSTIQALASAVDAKDQYTHDHSARVAQLCVATARELGISDTPTCREVELAGLLHDIGKIGVPDAILSKPGPLTPEEYAVAKTHVNIGAAMVESIPGLEPVALAIRHHHERCDGLGYPSGLAGEAIPLASKLIAAVDVFDTLTSNRPYRKCSSREGAVHELRKSKGTHLDPAIVDAFLSVIKREERLEAPEAGGEAAQAKAAVC